MNTLKVLDRAIAFHRCFVTLTGSVTAALMLSQAIYWSNRTDDPEGWFYKNADEWEDETGLTRREQEGARTKLRKTGFWEEKLKGSPPTLHYRVNEEILEKHLNKLDIKFDKKVNLNSTKEGNQIQQNVEFKFDKRGKSNSTEKGNRVRQKGELLLGTEITTEITTEIIPEPPALEPPAPAKSPEESPPKADSESDQLEADLSWTARALCQAVEWPLDKLSSGRRENLLQAEKEISRYKGATPDRIVLAGNYYRAHDKYRFTPAYISADWPQIEAWLIAQERKAIEANGSDQRTARKSPQSESRGARAARQTFARVRRAFQAPGGDPDPDSGNPQADRNGADGGR